MSKHTPGPWFLFDHARGQTLQVSSSTDHTNEFAVVHWMGFDSSDKPRSEKRANARLIAAAPTMYEALQDLCDTLGECGLTEKARAAIAKATGEAA